jgi:hypothetical protein
VLEQILVNSYLEIRVPNHLLTKTVAGGSLRIPASACGIFTLRPSLGRFPTGGCTSGLAGQEAVNSVNGCITSLTTSEHRLINSRTHGQNPV